MRIPVPERPGRGGNFIAAAVFPVRLLMIRALPARPLVLACHCGPWPAHFEEKAMSKTLAGFILAAGLALAPAIAQAECSGHGATASTTPPAPVQTAEAPAPSQTK
jgi:hypothetical protein